MISVLCFKYILCSLSFCRLEIKSPAVIKSFIGDDFFEIFFVYRGKNISKRSENTVKNSLNAIFVSLEENTLFQSRQFSAFLKFLIALKLKLRFFTVGWVLLCLVGVKVTEVIKWSLMSEIIV